MESSVPFIVGFIAGGVVFGTVVLIVVYRILAKGFRW